MAFVLLLSTILCYKTSATSPVIVGPYKTATTTITLDTLDSSDRRVDIHYPIVQQNESFPLIAYAHGLDNAATDYTNMSTGLVSFGYIVALHWSCKEGCNDDKASLSDDPPFFAHYYVEQLKVINWLRTTTTSSNNTVTLPFNIDFSRGVAIAGHSMGGQSTLFSSSYGNASEFGISAAVMHHAFTHEYPAPDIPFLAFTGGEDFVASHTMTERYYDAASTSGLSRGLVYKKNADHFEPEDPFCPFYWSYNPILPQLTAAWFKLHLENRKVQFGIDFEAMIYGNTSSSICNGGDGAMVKCEVHY